MLKKVCILLCVLTLVFSITAVLPVFAETTEEKEETSSSELIYYYVQDASGRLLLQFSLIPQKDLLFDIDGAVNEEIPAYLNDQIAYLKRTGFGKKFNISLIPETNELRMQVIYDSLTDYAIDWGVTGFEKSEGAGAAEKSFFFIKYITKEVNEWSYSSDPENIYGFLKQTLLDIGEDEDNILFTYVRGTKYDGRAISSDADEVVKTQGVYMHLFHMTAATIDREITFTQTNPNPVGWYSVALIAGVLIVAAGLTYYFIRKKKGDN